MSARYRIRRTGQKWGTAAGETFIYRSRRGNLLIGIKGQGTKPFYVLKKSVEVKPRFGFFASWRLLERKLLPKLMRREIQRALRKRGAK